MPRKAKRIQWKIKFQTIKNELIKGQRKGRKENMLSDDMLDSIYAQAEKQTTKELGFTEREARKDARKKITKNTFKLMYDGNINTAKKVATRKRRKK